MLFDLTPKLVRAARRYRLAADVQLRTLGLSDATALAMALLHRMGDGVRQGVLAEEMGLEGPSLVRLIDQLQASGLVTRAEDASDRRAKLLSLTPHGVEVGQAAEALLAKLRAELFAGIPVEQVRACLLVLNCLEAALDRWPGVQAP